MYKVELDSRERYNFFYEIRKLTSDNAGNVKYIPKSLFNNVKYRRAYLFD